MNAQNFTKMSLEAIQTAQNLAIENQNAQVEEEHILFALITEENSFVKELLKKLGINDNFQNEL